MPDHVAVIALAVTGLVAFLVYKATVAVGEAREEKQRGLRALGFEPLDPPPEDLTASLLALHGHGRKGRRRLEGLFERKGSGHRLYLFDLKDTSGEGTRSGVIAVVSPRLRVPRLTIFPRFQGDGLVARLANLLVRKLGRRHGGLVDFVSHEPFSRRHHVAGPDEAAIRHFLTDRRLEQLAGMERMAVEAEGDRLTYQRIRFGRRRTGSDRDEVAHRTREAEELLRVLQG